MSAVTTVDAPVVDELEAIIGEPDCRPESARRER